MLILGENIAKARKKCGLTQQELATYCDITRSTIGNIEANLRIPDLRVLLNISLITGVSIDNLIKGNINTNFRLGAKIIEALDDNNKKALGKELKFQRKIIKLHQHEIASRLGITKQSISNYENGRTVPNIEVLYDFCQLLSIDIDELLMYYRFPENSRSYKRNNNHVKSIEIIEKNENPSMLHSMTKHVRSSVRTILEEIIIKWMRSKASTSKIIYPFYRSCPNPNWIKTWTETWNNNPPIMTEEEIREQFDSSFPNWRNNKRAFEIEKAIDDEIEYLHSISLISRAIVEEEAHK